VTTPRADADARPGAALADAAERRRQADEGVARRLSRLMKASTSPLGVWSDPPLIGLAGAVTVLSALLCARFVAAPIPAWALWGLALLPFGVGVCATVALAGARARVVDWLASLPFPVGNVNGLLNGVGQNLRIRFKASRPTAEELDELLRQVDEGVFGGRAGGGGADWCARLEAQPGPNQPSPLLAGAGDRRPRARSTLGATPDRARVGVLGSTIGDTLPRPGRRRGGGLLGYDGAGRVVVFADGQPPVLA
jgi:hypothetical protein